MINHQDPQAELARPRTVKKTGGTGTDNNGVELAHIVCAMGHGCAVERDWRQVKSALLSVTLPLWCEIRSQNQVIE
ncbi:MAG: hypothetical protein DHS20C06_08750 [Hyphobacterium sp.]|nr:MAG: hypothetical protein DHS20C06_08750 [Hyphobacterium sp.]